MPYATQADIVELYGANALVVADHDGDGVPACCKANRRSKPAEPAADHHGPRRGTVATHHRRPVEYMARLSAFQISPTVKKDLQPCKRSLTP